MSNATTLLLYGGGIMFASAALIAFKNYWTTRGLTNYWLLITVTALFGAAWTGTVILGEVFGFAGAWLHESRLVLITTSLVGYTASLLKASAADVVTEII